jgi:hypothetical protein
MRRWLVLARVRQFDDSCRTCRDRDGPGTVKRKRRPPVPRKGFERATGLGEITRRRPQKRERVLSREGTLRLWLGGTYRIRDMPCAQRAL